MALLLLFAPPSVSRTSLGRKSSGIISILNQSGFSSFHKAMFAPTHSLTSLWTRSVYCGLFVKTASNRNSSSLLFRNNSLVYCGAVFVEKNVGKKEAHVDRAEEDDV